MRKYQAVRSEDLAHYEAKVTEQEDTTIFNAITILRRRLGEPGAAMENPKACSEYIVLHNAEHQREVFSVMFLDTRHRFLAYEQLFFGTVDAATVHPREVVKRALELNAAALILSHNHPSGVPTPSSADAGITRRIVDACALVDIRVLDHIVVGGVTAVSMASLGMM